MKIAFTLLIVLFTAGAHAELLVPKGAKGTLKVEYVFTSGGSSGSASRGDINIWSSRRTINITAQFAADAPQAFGSMHVDDPKQKAKINDMQAKATSAAKKMEPMQNDMMSMAKQCGFDPESSADMSKAEEAAFEACISKGAAAYGTNTKMTPELKSAQADIKSASNVGAPRFQLWQLTTQTGTYLVDEKSSKQVFEMTCTNTRICKRTITTKGGGPIPSPGQSIAGAFTLEVDKEGKDMVVRLPNALVPLKTETVVESTIQDDDTTRSGPGNARPLGLDAKPVVAIIKGDLPRASGTQIIPIKGEGVEGGTLTINWEFAAN
jgi:hypothetical protein